MQLVITHFHDLGLHPFRPIGSKRFAGNLYARQIPKLLREGCSKVARIKLARATKTDTGKCRRQLLLTESLALGQRLTLNGENPAEFRTCKCRSR